MILAETVISVTRQTYKRIGRMSKEDRLSHKKQYLSQKLYYALLNCYTFDNLCLFFSLISLKMKSIANFLQGERL